MHIFLKLNKKILAKYIDYKILIKIWNYYKQNNKTF